MTDCQKCKEYIREADRRVGELFAKAENAESHCIRTQLARLTDVNLLEQANSILESLMAPDGVDMNTNWEVVIERHLAECREPRP